VAAAPDLNALSDWFGGGARRPRLSTLARRRRGAALLSGLPRLGLPQRGGRGARLSGPLSPAHVPDDVRQRLEVVGPFLRRVRRQPDYVPPTGHHEPRGVHFTQVP
jgi:hypothetical protein